jgi:hypothetical protein
LHQINIQNMYTPEQVEQIKTILKSLLTEELRPLVRSIVLELLDPAIDVEISDLSPGPSQSLADPKVY